MNAPTHGKRDVYIAGLPEETDDAKVKELFQPYGEVTWCRALQREGSKTCGLVEFATAEQAAWVVQNMQGSVPAGLADPIMVKYKDDPWERKGKGKGGFFGDDEISNMRLAGAGITVPPLSSIAAAAAAANYGKGGKEPSIIMPPKGGVMGNLLPPEMQPPPPEPMPSDNIYLRNLPTEFSEEKLKDIFKTFGTITQYKLMPVAGKHAALVRFSTVAEAIAAVASLKTTIPAGLTELVEAKFAECTQRQQNQRYAGDGTPFGIDTIVRGFQMSGLMPGGTGYGSIESALYIAGLPAETTDYHLYRLFSPLGAIAPKGVRTLTNEDGTCKGIAFVNYLEVTSAQMAISIYNGTIMPDGSRLKVAIKSPKVTGPPPVVVPAPVRPVMPEGFTAPSVAPPVPAAVNPATIPMTIPPPPNCPPPASVVAEAGENVNPGMAAMAAAAAAAAKADAEEAKAALAAGLKPAAAEAPEAA